MAHRASPLLSCLFVLLALCSSARAAGTVTTANLGTAATTGKEASEGIKARAAALHLAMACGNELDFARRFRTLSHSFKNHQPPPDPIPEWPVTLLVGKAALLIDQSRERACESTLDGNVLADWGGLASDGKSRSGETAAQVVNRVFCELYDMAPNGTCDQIPISGASGSVCGSVANESASGLFVSLNLSDDCLAREIRAVITDPGHGAFKWDSGVVTPELPGTSASKLLCLSETKPELKKSFPFLGVDFSVRGVDGDWDQAVLEYTRLASLLYRFGRSSSPGGIDVAATLVDLNRRFLTLRSSPEQGATARETFNLAASCGDQPNQFGDAIDTVNGTGSDPGYDSYSDAAKDAVGKKSFWDSLWRFLKALIVLAGIAIVAAAAGVAVALITELFTGAVQVALIAGLVIAVTVLITGLFGGIEESENHLLMQNSARYIKNKLMMAELSGQSNIAAFDVISKLNEELRVWLLERLQRIAREDFIEYNAKPYNRLSHASILNLLDYACDVSWNSELSPFILNTDDTCDEKDLAIVRAAASVLDLSAAKDAVGSLEGRRLVPYRRLVTENSQFYDDNRLFGGNGQFYDARSILELVQGADNQLAALEIWTGQRRHAPGIGAPPNTFDQLEWYSTSQYRPDPMILDIAVNKTIPREQQYRHYTRERYASGNGWLITAGGTDERPAQGFRSPLGFTIYLSATNDRGAGVPTTLMTGAPGRAKVQDFLRFDGNKKDWGFDDGPPPVPRFSFSDNNCVAGSFACGLTPRLPSDFDAGKCRTLEVASNFFIVDSTKCPSFNDGDASSANDIFIAIFQGPKGWGFFEVAQQTDYSGSAAAFAAAIKINNKDRFDKWNSADSGDTVEYFAVTQNRLLKFTPKNEDFSADRRACGVVNHESGARLTISNVPAAQAAACLSVGPRIFIDLNDAMNPIRRGEGGLALDPFGR